VALDRGGPAYAWLVSGALLLMVLSPLCRPPGADSFPWSSYPMFGRGLASAHTTVHHMIAFDAAGGRRVVPPTLVANDEVLQAEATLHRAARGKQQSLELCRQVAARLADDPAWADIVRVELRSERYDAIAYFEGDTAPIRPGRLRARCTPPGVVDPADAQQPAKKPKKKKQKRRTRKPPAPTPNLSPGTPPTNLSPGTPPTNLSPGTPPAPAGTAASSP